MKRFEAHKLYIVFMVIMSVFISILPGCGGGGGGSWYAPGGAASSLTVSSTDPANGEIGVFRNTEINATFSGPVDSATITAATFTVKQGTTVVPGTVTFSPVTAVFSPTNVLAANTVYTATITTGVKNPAGIALASDYVWSFTTGATSDVSLPTVIATINANNAINVPINTKVGATFSKVMNSTTLTTATFTLTHGTTPVLVPGTVTYSGVNAVFTPTGNLLPNTLYTATITTGAKDLSVPGNSLAVPFVWSWTTGAALDTTAPKLTVENPANLATGVAINSPVRATFDKPMDLATITNLTFTLKNGTVLVAGQVTYDALTKVATLKPSVNLLPNTTYTANVTNGAKDLAGNVLTAGLVPNPWTFTTATTVVTPPAGAVPLGSAGTFGIMATSAITNTGAGTMINGDVALDPGTSNGLLPVQVSGAIHINDTVSAQARLDLLAAYNFAKNLPPGTTISAGADLGALNPGGVLPPGTYTSGSTMLVSTNLTLNGSATDVWIFQIGSSLTTTANVILGPGVLAKNVFWVPTLDATVGVNSTFEGTIVAGRDTTAKTGATINGRILTGATLAGTIALDTNIVNVPAP
jgi:hypothetical protein